MTCKDCIHNEVCYMRETCNDIEKQIKEFAKRLKDKHKHNKTSVVSLVTVFDNINELVKEMVGETE